MCAKNNVKFRKSLAVVVLAFGLHSAGRTQELVPSTFSGIGCYAGSKFRISPAHSALSFDTNECDRLHMSAMAYSNAGTWQKGYDTTKAYLTLCHDDSHAPFMFLFIQGDNESRSDDMNRFIEEREWLKSVLYLSHDSLWYCRDVEDIVYSFDWFAGHGWYQSGSMAVLKYVLDHHKCDSVSFTHLYNGYVVGRYKVWKDSVKDSVKTPLDTTLPTIDELGLSLLRGPTRSVTIAKPGTFELLEGLRSTENPFTRETSVRFQLNEYGLVKFELFDALGRLQTDNGIGQVLDPGSHTFHIDGSTLGRGIYFARLSYHNGEVKSLMLRKE